MSHTFKGAKRYWFRQAIMEKSKGLYSNVENNLFDDNMEENVTCTRGHTKTQIQEYKYANTQMFVDA